ncbi:hypothetical protein VKT23_014638 [Stygiomarasmius scandens]|uniref:Uncharacterized protein n=1 Tax=Marasmiellus scandens TaxID=2682957 RepID=A0ABR1J4J7_9AGAR
MVFDLSQAHQKTDTETYHYNGTVYPIEFASVTRIPLHVVDALNVNEMSVKQDFNDTPISLIQPGRHIISGNCLSYGNRITSGNLLPAPHNPARSTLLNSIRFDLTRFGMSTMLALLLSTPTPPYPLCTVTEVDLTRLLLPHGKSNSSLVIYSPGVFHHHLNYVPFMAHRGIVYILSSSVVRYDGAALFMTFY